MQFVKRREVDDATFHAILQTVFRRSRLTGRIKRLEPVGIVVPGIVRQRRFDRHTRIQDKPQHAAACQSHCSEEFGIEVVDRMVNPDGAADFHLILHLILRHERRMCHERQHHEQGDPS